MKPHLSKGLDDAFVDQLELWGVSLERERLEALALYAESLSRYDRANLVGTRDLGELWLNHVLDSLSCLLYEPISAAESLVDVGSGGGMPGLPLHLAAGFQRTCLLESTGKKAEFLRYVSSELRATSVEVVNDRAEEVGRSERYRESFDVATVRAVAPLAVISEYCLPLLTPGGTMIAMKARLDPEERGAGERAAEKIGGEVEGEIKVPFAPHLESKERRLVLVKKVCHTPDRYPRKPGVPGKSPLGIGG